jgi:alpha-ketoglutarate-dependent taurine dioxygenase
VQAALNVVPLAGAKVASAPASPLSPRALRADELVFPTRLQQFPSVIEARPGDPSLPRFVGERSAEIRALLREQGALLFRGFAVADADEFEAALTAADLAASPDYPFGVSPRRPVTKRVFNSTDYANFLVIPPHTEMAYLRWRPRWIAFYCHVQPERYGETPVYDTARALELLPPALRQRLETSDMRYVRYIRHKAAIVRFERTIEETFGTTDRGAIETACRSLDIDARWIGDKFLRAETVLPAVIEHPESGRKCLNAQFINGKILIAGIARIRDRYPFPVRHLFNAYIKMQFRKPTVHYRSTPATGPDFTDAEMDTINDAIHGASTIFRWQRGDMILIDNIRGAHARLNVKGERRILTALGDMYDVKSARRPV